MVLHADELHFLTVYKCEVLLEFIWAILLVFGECFITAGILILMAHLDNLRNCRDGNRIVHACS